jgi:STE24 endopeptidase
VSSAFTWVFLLAVAAASATRLWLSQRQIRHVRAHRDAVPGMFAEAIPLAAHQKAADYTVAKSRLGIVDTLLDAAILLVLTLGGVLQWLSNAWETVFPATSLWHGTALILTVFFLKGLIGLPLSVYRIFVIEERFEPSMT